jgi:hypothetical protein
MKLFPILEANFSTKCKDEIVKGMKGMGDKARGVAYEEEN